MKLVPLILLVIFIQGKFKLQGIPSARLAFHGFISIINISSIALGVFFEQLKVRCCSFSYNGSLCLSDQKELCVSLTLSIIY